jgi:protein XRP2
MGQKKSTSAKQTAQYGYSWEVNRNPPRLKSREELNINDFIIKERNGEIIVREPGSVAGQQLVIENCNDCDFFITDFSAEVSVDDCKNCRFFFGPIEGSFFIRTSSDCKVVVACKQFRTRDCNNIEVLLYAQGRPIIESTTNIRLGCFDTFYVGLQGKFLISLLIECRAIFKCQIEYI